jgi:Flp pilus assembly protein TadD
MHFRSNILIALILVAAAILPYAGSWNGEFLWDDNTILAESELIADSSGWWKIWIDPPPSHPDYFPLTSLSFWLEWRIWGDSPHGYRVMNTLLHAATVLMLWRLLQTISIPGAWLAALLFALHPVNAESVAWISERKNLLAMTFAIPSFIWFLRWDASRKPLPYMASIILFFLAAAAKASVVTLPLVFAAWAIWRYGIRAVKSIAIPLIPYFIVSLGFGLAVFYFQHNRAMANWDIPMPSLLGRFGQAGLAFWFYIVKAIFPIDLSTIYSPWLLNPASVPVLALACITCAVISIFWFSRSAFLRGLAFGVTAYLLLLLPTLGLLKMSFLKYAPVSDHFQHLALPAILATISAGGVTLMSKFPLWRLIGYAVMASVLIPFATSTFTRANIHASHEALWRDAMAKNPASPQPHTVLATILKKSDRTAEALTHFQKAAFLAPQDPLVLTNLGIFHLETGNPMAAMEPLRRAVATGQKYPEAPINLSRALLLQGKLDEALTVLKSAADKFPEDISLNSAAGASLLLADRNAEALVYLSRCQSIMPRNKGFKIDTATALERMGRKDEANFILKQMTH